MNPFVAYPLIAPFVFALAFMLYHWEKLTLEGVGWNFFNSYALFALLSLIVAAVDRRHQKRKSETRAASCIVTMVVVALIPFVLNPYAWFEPVFLMVLVAAAIVAAGICCWISTGSVQPTAPEEIANSGG
jgi:hypothetical protein